MLEVMKKSGRLHIQKQTNKTNEIIFSPKVFGAK